MVSITDSEEGDELMTGFGSGAAEVSGKKE